MSKETFYFSHDYNARSDRKLVNVIMKHGMMGIGVYWCIVEMAYEEGGYLPLEYERISFELRSDTNVVQSIINDFELFENDKEKFWSNTVLERLNLRAEKSKKARESITKRWKKNKENTKVSENDTNVTKIDTIKERKAKDIKGEDIKVYENKKVKNSRRIQEDFFSEPDKEPEERKEQEQSRARAHERDILLETEFNNLPDLMGGDPEPESEPQEQGLDLGTEAESDKKVIFLFAEPKQPPVAEELGPKKSGESETKSAEPVVEKVHVPDRDDVQGTDNEDPVRSAKPRVTVNPEPCLGSEPNESLIVNAEPELKVDPAEVKFHKRRTIDDDW